MIFLVIATYAVFRGAAVNVLGKDFPYQSGAFFSDGMAKLLHPWVRPPTCGWNPAPSWRTWASCWRSC
jgi:hypothetical protein